MIPGATPIKDFFLLLDAFKAWRTNDHMHVRRLADTLHTREPTHVAHTHTRTHTHTHTHTHAHAHIQMYAYTHTHTHILCSLALPF